MAADDGLSIRARGQRSSYRAIQPVFGVDSSRAKSSNTRAAAVERLSDESTYATSREMPQPLEHDAQDCTRHERSIC
jgi:hypothetical protein